MATKKDDAASRSDDESPEWTRKDFERARPALPLVGEIFGADAAQAIARRRKESPNFHRDQTVRLRFWALPSFRARARVIRLIL